MTPDVTGSICMLHCAPSLRLPRPVFAFFHVDPQSSERHMDPPCEPVPSHTRRESKGSTTMAAPTVPFTAPGTFPAGVTFSHVPGSGRWSQSRDVSWGVAGG